MSQKHLRENGEESKNRRERDRMRAPFQILALPYRKAGSQLMFCVFHRADHNQWQFISGGGEDNETPAEAARREVFEESGVRVKNLIALTSQSFIPVSIFSQEHRANWPKGTFVVPEYCFGFACEGEITLSHEHTQYVWLPYDEAANRLAWDSNRTALYELMRRLTAASE